MSSSRETMSSLSRLLLMRVVITHASARHDNSARDECKCSARDAGEKNGVRFTCARPFFVATHAPEVPDRESSLLLSRPEFRKVHRAVYHTRINYPVPKNCSQTLRAARKHPVTLPIMAQRWLTRFSRTTPDTAMNQSSVVASL